MSTVTFSRLIEAPADELWRVFTDLPARPRWLCHVHAVEVLATAPGGTDPPSALGAGAGAGAMAAPGPGAGFGIGTVWRERRTGPDGTGMVEEFAVREAAPPRRLVISSSGDGVDYLTTYTFIPVEARRSGRRRSEPRRPGRGRTVLTVSHEGVPTARYGRLLAVVFGGLAARAGEGALRRDLADLATATEPGRIDPATAA
ncbi:SRPBCC family protein [Plantactinospora sp. WMMC1484]|uniref:SRPBCC family protein n=1 Tax=Plantactinospora sp. WMMC1484 TaxID=3404122 RepID=UPI003BF4871B